LSHGRISTDSAEIDGAGYGSAGLGRRCAGHGVLYFSIIGPEENASCSGANRHLREARKISKAASRQTGRFSRSPADTGVEKENTESAAAAVQRGSGITSRKVQAYEAARDTRDFREGTFWRARTPDHPEASGCCQVIGQGGIEP